jgi:hypothetical protein
MLLSSSTDPHFATWQGNHFSYHGKYYFVLVHNSKFAEGQGLDVHVRTEHMLDGRYYFVSHAAKTRIGEDVLESTADGSHFVNGHANATLPLVQSGGFPVVKTEDELCGVGGREGVSA